MNSTLECEIIEPTCQAQASVIWMHGLGADCNDFVDLVPLLQLPNEASVRFVFPNAPIRPVTINAQIPMRAWFDIFSLESMQREDDAGVRESQQAIDELIEQEITRGIPSEKIILAGFSQGGAMALFAGLRYPKPVGGILALSCFLPLLSTIEQERHQHNNLTPIFLTHGDFDDIVPLRLSQTSYDKLLQLGYDVTWRTYPMGHEVSMAEIHDIGQWLGHTLT